MRIVFYSPSLALDGAAPSGAARTAHLMIAALELAGHRVVQPARLRSIDDGTAPGRAERLRDLGDRLAARLTARWRAEPLDGAPALWITCRPSAAAPDWLGPRLCAEFGIPYVVVQPALDGGGAASGQDALRRAVASADAVVVLSAAAAAAAEGVRGDGRSNGATGGDEAVQRLRPFVDLRPFAPISRMRDRLRATLAAQLNLPLDSPWLLTVAMMRPGAKLDSYRVLAGTLARMALLDWHLIVVGDGPERPAVEAALGHLPRARVRMCGELPAENLLGVYAASDLYVWPALGEEHAMAILEAQASGLPVLAARGPTATPAGLPCPATPPPSPTASTSCCAIRNSARPTPAMPARSPMRSTASARPPWRWTNWCSG